MHTVQAEEDSGLAGRWCKKARAAPFLRSAPLCNVVSGSQPCRREAASSVRSRACPHLYLYQGQRVELSSVHLRSVHCCGIFSRETWYIRVQIEAIKKV